MIMRAETTKGNAQQSNEEHLIETLSIFSRKRPDKGGARQLAQMAVHYDLSYATTLISVANTYFGEALRQWSKYQGELQQEVTSFMKHLNYKIEYARLPALSQ